MELIKLLVIFAIIVALLIIKKPLNLVLTAASIAVIILFPMAPNKVFSALKNGCIGQSSLDALLVLYCITFLQRMMEKRDRLKGCRLAMSGLFNNRRINVSAVPFMLGCLPAASTVLICGPIVRESVGNELSIEEKAACTSFFRHISEAFLPTYSTIVIALSCTGGRVTASQFVLAMLPVVFFLFLAGWIVYLRKIPSATGIKPTQSKPEYFKMLVQSIWPIAVSIAIILLVPAMPVWGAVLICIVVNFFTDKFTVKEILPYFKSAFEANLMINTLATMVFGQLLSETGVISVLPKYVSALPIPEYLIYALLFVIAPLFGASKAVFVLVLPLAVASVGSGSFLSLFVLLMSVNYTIMQVSPTHICLTLCAEDFKVPLGSLIAKVMPMVITMLVFVFGYFYLLRAFGL